MIVNKEMYNSILKYFKNKKDLLTNLFLGLTTDKNLQKKAINNLYYSMFMDNSSFSTYYINAYEMYGDKFLDIILTRKNLIKIINYLHSKNLNNKQIIMSIVDNPGLIFLAGCLNRLLVIEKDNSYYGLLMVDDNGKSYSYYFVDDENLLLANVFADNTYLMKTLNNFLNRDDSLGMLGIREEDSFMGKLIRMKQNDNNTGFKIR